ncbi:FMN-binding protein [Clostridium sp. DJ247]|uniref:FMN-binding protein n=1 Tax=Clostridium sp. DJ247 TaxID=2726188 RepID=UPI00162583AB|nr:FMN-binding protein [Clostridium sp. DJ247]MBC2578807.1 FMN-binding protein [Clostridium sp. DJ247]
MNNVKKIVLSVFFIAVLTGGIFGVKYLLSLQKYQKTIKEISIGNVDLSKVKDGIYTGSFDAEFISAESSITVKNHKITDIKLVKHKNEKGKSAEVIPERVVKAQTLQVDAVSGATNSSKVILKSIENALKNEKIN